MKAKILTSILVGILVISFISAGLAIAANGNGAGLERVPVFIGFRQTPGPSEQALVRAHGGAIKYSYTIVPAIAASIPEPAIEGLMRNPNVTYIEPVIEVYAVTQTVPWGVERIGAPTVHDGGNKGEGVKVAIIDSGIDYTHPDLDGNYVTGYDFVNDDDYPMDDNGHGTHCAGIVAAEDNDTGVVGVAPGAHLYALKVLNRRGSGNFSDVVAALQWAVANGMDVTSNSYGSSVDPGFTVEEAFDNAELAGIVNVCAAGNEGAGADTVIYPAKYDSCIAVAATNSSDIRASFSSTGPAVELAAPGVGIMSTIPGNLYQSWSGTSMACPHVAGTAALVIAAGIPNVRTKLRDTAIDLGAVGKDIYYGYGRVNAADAVAGSTEPPPVQNKPPVADSQSVGTDEDTSVSIKLTASDPEGDSLTYHIVSGPSHGSLSGATPNVIYTPNINYYGSDSFSFKVNDGNSDSNPATVSIDIIAVNDPPVADAGSDQSAFVGETVNFDGSDSDDPDGSIVSYDWNFGDGATGSGMTTIHAYAAVGIYTATLTVTDNGHLTDTDTVTITVTEQSTSSTMHVEDITIVVGAMGRNAQAIAYVLIMGENGPVGGAAVTAEWAFNSVSLSEISSTTDGEGVAVLYSPKVKAKSGVFTIKITNIEKSGRTYVPGDGDEASQSFP